MTDEQKSESHINYIRKIMKHKLPPELVDLTSEFIPTKYDIQCDILTKMVQNV